MRVSASKLTVDCPHCKNKNIIENANGVTSVECSSCRQSIELPKLVGSVQAKNVVVMANIGTLNFDDL